jgi:TfoX/Sxy family transcriptional regulator of competence genes
VAFILSTYDQSVPIKPKNVKQNAKVNPRFAPVVEAFTADPDVTAGKMMTSFGLKVNDKIFAMVVKGRLVVKLPKARVDEMVSGGLGEPLETGNGRKMKEWVAMTGDADWVDLAREAYAFVKEGTA